MIKSITKKTNNKKGFTLIELIVVIAILGILAAIAIPRFSGVRDTAANGAAAADARTVLSAMGMYYAEEGVYPTPTVDAKIPADTISKYLDNANMITSVTAYTIVVDSSVNFTYTANGGIAEVVDGVIQ